MIYKIHNHIIDGNLRSVSVDGKQLNVEPKVYDLIYFLIQNPNKAISKDQLQDAVWPGLEVSETAITRAIMKARKCLNDGNDVQSYIQTIHGHGYKLVANIEVIDKAVVPGATHSILPWWQRKKVLFVLALTALLSFIGVGSLYLNRDVVDDSSKLAVLPVINKTNNKDFSWVSLGLMSLAVQMIQAENSISTISNSASSQIKDLELADDFQMADEQISSLKDQLKATHLVFSMLENADDDLFKLSYSVYHPKGKQDVIELVGNNPTELTQKMVNQITNKLPNSSIAIPKFKAISDNSFTNELYARGVAHRLEGDAKAARGYFSLVIKEEPDLFWPRYQYALTSNKLGQYDEAIESLEQLLKDIPTILNDKDLEAGVNNAIGISYMQKSDHKQGIAYYSKAYEIAKESGNRDYQEKIASNIAWIYKDKRDFDKSRVWLAKSIESRKGLDLPPNINNIYLKGQLEYLMNHFDKAEDIFKEAYDLYVENNHNRQAAKVLNLRAKVQNLKGSWSKAHEIVDESFKLSEKVDDDLGRLDSHYMRTQVYSNEGKYSQAMTLVNENTVKAEALNQQRKLQNWKKQEINLLYKQGSYELALEKLENMEKQNESSEKELSESMQLIKHKIAYTTGNPEPLLNWITDYSEDNQNQNSQSQLKIQRLKIFMLEADREKGKSVNNDTSMESLISAYRHAIKLEHELGYQASLAKKLIKIAQLNIQSGNQPGFTDAYNELQLLELDWWQVDLLTAYKEHQAGNFKHAKVLAAQAKQNSTENWNEKDEEIFILIDSPV